MKLIVYNVYSICTGVYVKHIYLFKLFIKALYVFVYFSKIIYVVKFHDVFFLPDCQGRVMFFARILYVCM